MCDTLPVEFVRPVQAVIPGAHGRILAVLAETTADLNLRTVARLSGVSLAHASRVLPRLVELGMVERREAPPSALFRFVPGHVASRAITALTRTRQTVLDELGSGAAELNPAPVSVIVFGSFARGEADGESDIDVVVVRPSEIKEEDDDWRSGIDGWRSDARTLTGNGIELLELAEADAIRLLRGRTALWADIQRDGVVVFGVPLVVLRSQRGA